MNSQKSVPEDLITIITKVMDNKIYGSVEIFFQAGKITQITERTINKLSETKAPKFAKKIANTKQYNETPTIQADTR